MAAHDGMFGVFEVSKRHFDTHRTAITPPYSCSAAVEPGSWLTRLELIVEFLSRRNSLHNIGCRVRETRLQQVANIVWVEAVLVS